MIKSIIVDDEQFTLDEIRDTIKGFNELEVVEATTNPNKALEIIKKHNIQLAFLDIEMQGISGISLAEKMIEIKPNIEVVFITAYDNYAYDAFEANAIDYVLKPIRVERLEKTIKKVLKIIKTQNLVLHYKNIPHKISEYNDERKRNMSFKTEIYNFRGNNNGECF